MGRIKYIPGLDGLRGFAILAVLIYHAVSRLLPGGFIGVDLFFVVSGFLITFLLVSEWNSSGNISLTNFYLRRFLRLGPALILFLIVYVGGAGFLSGNWESTIIDAALVLGYISNWVLAAGSAYPHAIAHAWSLSIEEQFYLCWPPILRVLLKGSYWNSVIGLSFILVVQWVLRAAMAMKGTPVSQLYYGTFLHSDGLILGCILGLMYTQFPKGEKAHRWISVMVCPALIFVVAFFCFGKINPLYFVCLSAAVTLSSGILVAGVYERVAGIDQIFSWTPLVWLGKISYGLYLWHYLIFRYLEHRPDVSEFERLVYGSALSLFVAAVSYYGMERKFLMLKDRLRKRAIVA